MAERTEIASEIEALAVHCRTHVMEAGARALWLRDWCSDLAEFPIEAIRVACRKYRHSGATKFPTPGQLLPMVRAELPQAKAPMQEPWRPLSDSEYSALTLEGKIRHHRILAAEARTKAGPMFRNTGHLRGDHLTPEQMPTAWFDWTKRAENHEAEARRLWEALRRAQTQQPAVSA